MINLNSLEAFELEELAKNDIANIDVYVMALYDRHQYKRAIRLFNNYYKENINKPDVSRSMPNVLGSSFAFGFCYMQKTEDFMMKDYKKGNLFNIVGLSYKYENDEEKFIEFMNKAIKEGYYDSFAQLGLYYLTCETPDKNKAMKYFEIAEQYGSEYVNVLLAEMYFYGLYGFEQNKEMAMDYLKKADSENEFVKELKKKL